MKKLIIISLLALSGCTTQGSEGLGMLDHDLNVGDCYMAHVNSGPMMVFKVLRVGKYSYESLGTDGQIYTSNGKGNSNQVDCFSRF